MINLIITFIHYIQSLNWHRQQSYIPLNSDRILRIAQHDLARQELMR